MNRGIRISCPSRRYQSRFRTWCASVEHILGRIIELECSRFLNCRLAERGRGGKGAESDCQNSNLGANHRYFSPLVDPIIRVCSRSPMRVSCPAKSSSSRAFAKAGFRSHTCWFDRQSTPLRRGMTGIARRMPSVIIRHRTNQLLLNPSNSAENAARY
jgi:hypothetical protein